MIKSRKLIALAAIAALLADVTLLVSSSALQRRRSAGARRRRKMPGRFGPADLRDGGRGDRRSSPRADPGFYLGTRPDDQTDAEELADPRRGDTCPHDYTLPGSATLRASAARRCGMEIARASWAVRIGYGPAAMASESLRLVFLVKTRAGWRIY